MKVRYVALLSVVALAAALLYARERSHEETIEQMRAELHELSTSLQNVREQQGLSNRMGGVTIRPTVSQTASSTTVDAAAAEAEAGEGKPGADKPGAGTMEDFRAQMETAFQGETVNAEWADRSRAIAQERLRAALPASSMIQSVDCRHSMCRIETRHQDMSSYSQFIGRAFDNENTKLWNGNWMTTYTENPDKTVTAVAFLAGEGMNLPEMQ